MGVRGWNWHAWMNKDGIRKYMGFFESDDSALLFKRNHPDREFIRITNFGPTDLAKTAAKPSNERQATARVPLTREQMMARDRERTARESAMAEARAESRRKDREASRKRSEEREKREAAKAADREAMAGIREHAAELIEQHKADEGADLDAGINR